MNIEYIKNKVRYKRSAQFENAESLNTALDRLYISNDENKDRNSKLIGYCRAPQESYVEIDSNGKVSGKQITHAEYVESVSERSSIKTNALVTLKDIKPDSMNLVRFIYRPGKDVSDDDSKQEAKKFRELMFDFLDYIVPYFNEDNSHDYAIRYVCYGDHFYENDGKIAIEVISQSPNPSWLTQLWDIYIDYLINHEEKEGDNNEETSSNF